MLYLNTRITLTLLQIAISSFFLNVGYLENQVEIDHIFSVNEFLEPLYAYGQLAQNGAQPKLVCDDGSTADPISGICLNGSKASLTLFTCENGSIPDISLRCSNGFQATLVSVVCADGSIPNLMNGVCKDGSQPSAIPLVCANGSTLNSSTRKCSNGSQPRPISNPITNPTGSTGTSQPKVLCADGTDPNSAPNINGKCLDGSQPKSSTSTESTGPTVPDRTPPKIKRINPSSGAVGISVNSFITVTFSEPVQISSVSTSTFTLKDRVGNNVPGTVTMLPPGIAPELNTVMFRPSSPLGMSKSYIATVTTGIKDLAGNFMSSPVTWSFKTTTQASAGTSSNPAVPNQPPAGSNPPQTNPAGDTIPPSIVSTSPVNGATNVPLLATITARFSEPLLASTVSAATFKLKDSANIDIPGTVTLITVGPNVNTAMFKPASSLETSKLYSVTITIGMKDLAGNPLANAKKWLFTTAVTAPAQGTTPPSAGQPNLVCADGTNPNAAPNLNGKCIDGSQPR